MKTFKKWFSLLTGTIDGMFILIFAFIFLIAVASVIDGAWWHSFTAIASLAICYRLVKELAEIED